MNNDDHNDELPDEEIPLEDIPNEDLTKLLRAAAKDGGNDAWDRVYRLVEDELKCRVLALLRKGRPDVMVDATGVLDSAFLRLMGAKRATWKHRSDFYGHAARIMRNIIVDLYRKNQTQKRGGGWKRLPQTPDELGNELSQNDITLDLLALDDALENLEQKNAQNVQIFDLHFYGKLSHEEVAEILGMNLETVRDQWKLTAAFLYKELGGGESE